MRVKIKDTWYVPDKDTPICIELTNQDKINIKNMLPDATKYAIYDENGELDSEEKARQWMRT